MTFLKRRWLVLIAAIVIPSVIISCSTSSILSDSARATHVCAPFNAIERCHTMVRATSQPARAMVLALHPAYTSPQRVERLSGFAEQAAKQGFDVLYPEGIEQHWNDGRGAGKTKTVADNTDDVAYLTALTKRYANGKPVIAMGMSNGGMMAMRMVCDSEVQFAGMATVVSNLPYTLPSDCKQNYKLPIWLLFGSADGVVLPQGGAIYGSAKDWGKVESTADTLAFWQKRNGCDAANHQTENVDKIADDSTSLEITTNKACNTTNITVIGGGHAWPGEPAWYAWIFGRGPVSREMNASKTLLEWMQQVTPAAL